MRLRQAYKLLGGHNAVDMEGNELPISRELVTIWRDSGCRGLFSPREQKALTIIYKHLKDG